MASAAPEPRPVTVLIAGIGGGSLGLEIFKSLRLAGGYRILGTDISPLAFGLEHEGFARTVLLPKMSPREYAERLLQLCAEESVDAIAPGAEETNKIVAAHRSLFEEQGILLMINSPETLQLCADKATCLEHLRRQGIPVPAARLITCDADLASFDRFPCVVKPSRDSGGSNLVFMAENEAEAAFFTGYIKRRGLDVLVQEYIASEQEFTVGVLSQPDGSVVGSVALRRLLASKLSVALRYQDRVISSGWSQGLIDDFPEVRKQAERIAQAMGSTWALNIQGRLADDGIFYPFEINPRHSGTTYLRALAGFNEPDILLRSCLRNCPAKITSPRPGYYLRGFTERFVPAG